MRDLLVIGSGSAGVAAAIEAAERGADVAVVEAGTVGGTCVNVGCVPSKTLLRAAETYHRAAHSSFRGVKPGRPRLDFPQVIAQKAELVDELRQHKYVEVLESYGVPLIRGRARFRDAGSLEIDGETHAAKRYLITTGAAPTLPPIPGLADSRPWTYVEALSPEELPESLLVIGAGPVGLELAQAYARFGSRVTVLEALPRILPLEDEQVSSDLLPYLADEGLEIHTGARVTAVSRNGSSDGRYRVQARFGDEERTFHADRLLVATGRRPRTAELGLDAAGVTVGPDGAIEVDDHLATSNPAVYAAGDVAGLPQFVYVGAQSGRLAARNALAGSREALELASVPRVTFTDPAVASVGLTEREARARHDDVRISVLPLDQVPRALVAFDSRGFIKLVVDGEGTVLGLHVLAPEAGEVIQEGVVAVRFGMNYRDLIDTYHPYLTLVEGLRLVAQALDKNVDQLSCCA